MKSRIYLRLSLLRPYILWGFNGIAAPITLAVGYFCAGTGYAMYKHLQHLEIIKEAGTEIRPLAAEAG